MIATGSRVTYAMVNDNVIFKFIGKVNIRHGTLARAIIINAIWSMALIALGSFNKLLFFTGIAVWLFFALVGGGLFILRYKFSDIERPYKVWFFPLVPIIFIVVCIALFVNTLFNYTSQSIIGLCLVVSGIPVFIVSQKIVEKGKNK
jgi:APA family basic amino acid/polyamine antiporter